jgi:hypothetical protein
MALANHACTRAAQLFDRRYDEMSLDKVARMDLRKSNALGYCFPNVADVSVHPVSEKINL